jgi:hypothetical protein
MQKCELDALEEEENALFVCPLYAHLRLKHRELFANATDLRGVCQSIPAAEFFYDCYLMHAECVAED